MRKTLLLLPVMCWLFFACKKQSIETSPASQSSSNEENPVYKKLTELGFSPKDILDLGEYYLLDGDLLFHKKKTDLAFVTQYFQNIKKSMNSGSTERHWIMPGIVTDYNIQCMKISTDDFVNNGEITDWRRSAMQAMTAWANIGNTNINFTRYFNSYLGSPRYIDIVDDGGTLPDYVIAAAEPPFNGSPGWRIRINLDYNGNASVPNSQRVYNLVHELGHCMGFRHTNWQLIPGENQDGAIEVAGTSAGQDPNSVMNGGTADYSWVGFSTDDVIAAQVVYPVTQYTNWITNPASPKYPNYMHYYLGDYTNPITITWNTSLVSTPTVTLQVYQNGQFKQTIAANIPNTGSYSYPIMPAADGNAGSSSIYEVQVRIVSDADPNISDFSSMFDIVVD